MYTLRRIGAAAVALLPAVAGCDGPVEPTGPSELAGPAFSQNAAHHQTAAVNWHAQQQLIVFGGNGKAGPVDGAWARLVRNKNGISYQIHAGELHPGNAYSLWLVVVNNPAACAGTPCSAVDILTNPATHSQVTSGGTGTVAGAGGMGTLAGAARAGTLSGRLDGRSLDDPYSAEVHLVINDHGPMLPEFMPGMIKTYRAGCSNSSPFPGVFPATALTDGAPGPNTCLLYQAAIFPVP
jgi:hypothetical protein